MIHAIKMFLSQYEVTNMKKAYFEENNIQNLDRKHGRQRGKYLVNKDYTAGTVVSTTPYQNKTSCSLNFHGCFRDSWVKN